MKYECDMIRDLMPLCLDDSATDASKNATKEHMKECVECTEYYHALQNEIHVKEPVKEPEQKYVEVAKKLQKRKRALRIVQIGYCIVLLVFVLSYIDGYRMTPSNAAKTSIKIAGRPSIKLGEYRWKNMRFYFYDNQSQYDVVIVEPSLRGWRTSDISNTWMKEEGGEGIHTAIDLTYYVHNRGIRLFSLICYDHRVRTIECNGYGETKTIAVTAGEFHLVDFNAKDCESNEITAKAYDEDGNVLYQLVYQDGKTIWIQSKN